jgi:DMSO reductase family type II enzyme heme b subunit
VAELEAVETSGLWRIRLLWACPEPVRELAKDVDRFVDAAAVLAPTMADAPWMTMGAPGKAVQGALWRADRQELLDVRAEGLGTVERRPAPQAWKARAEWKAGQWRLELDLKPWDALDAQQQLALAIWQGAQGDRAGLKSVSPGWLDIGS